MFVSCTQRPYLQLMRTTEDLKICIELNMNLLYYLDFTTAVWFECDSEEKYVNISQGAYR